MSPRIDVLTEWPTREEDLPELLPGDEFEYVIAPQKFVALQRILVHDVILVRLRIGAVDEVPFELESEDGPQRTYKPRGLDDDALKKRLVATGAAASPGNTIALVPGLEVRMLLRNESAVSAKPRSALIVYEEVA